MNQSITYPLAFALGLMFTGSSVIAQTGQAQTQANTGSPVPTPTMATFAKPLPRIAERDILWKKRVWRDIDIREKQNSEVFGYTSETPNNLLVDVLIEGVIANKIKAYSTDNDMFTTVLSNQQFSALLNPSNQNTAGVPLLQPGTVVKFKIKEDWIFDNTTKALTVRLVGLAPVTEHINADGTRSERPIFWIYYPESRETLAQHDISSAINGINKGKQPASWNDYFEGRMFASVIEKADQTKIDWKPDTRTNVPTLTPAVDNATWNPTVFPAN